MRLAVGDPLLATCQLLLLRLDLRVALVHPLLDLRHLQAAVLDLGLDLGPQCHGLLPRLDLGLAPERLGLALCVAQERPPLILREAQPGRAHRPQPDPQPGGAGGDSDQSCDDREHALPSTERDRGRLGRRGGGRIRRSHRRDAKPRHCDRR